MKRVEENPANEPVLTIQEVADMKGMRYLTLWKAIDAGHIPVVRVMNRFGVRKSVAQSWSPRRRGGDFRSPTYRQQRATGMAIDPEFFPVRSPQSLAG